jgi:hypothetical protein
VCARIERVDIPKLGSKNGAWKCSALRGLVTNTMSSPEHHPKLKASVYPLRKTRSRYALNDRFIIFQCEDIFILVPPCSDVPSSEPRATHSSSAHPCAHTAHHLLPHKPYPQPALPASTAVYPSSCTGTPMPWLMHH